MTERLPPGVARRRSATETYVARKAQRVRDNPALAVPLPAPVEVSRGFPPSRHQCVYPLWPDDSAPTFEFCGAPVAEESPYYAAHHALCWRRLPTRAPGRPTFGGWHNGPAEG